MSLFQTRGERNLSADVILETAGLMARQVGLYIFVTQLRNGVQLGSFLCAKLLLSELGKGLI